jgi:hypothetical protein
MKMAGTLGVVSVLAGVRSLSAPVPESIKQAK